MANQKRNKAIYKCHEKGMFQTEIGKIFSLCQSAISQIINAVKNGIVGD